jgi:hypothetical protein
LVAKQLGPLVERLQTELGLRSPYRDPGVAEFGLENAVFAIGNSFLEVVAPVRPGTTAGRYLQKRGGDSGYMAIFQVPDLNAARRRLAELGVRVVWKADLSDMAATHLHPKDVPGAIVSLDWAKPPGSWRWAGPAWTGQVPDHRPGGIISLTVAAVSPQAVAQRWANVLAVDAHLDATDQSAEIALDDGSQTLRFVSCAADRLQGISEITVALDGRPPDRESATEIGGVRFMAVPTVEEDPR